VAKVSVIIPAHNSEATIGLALQAVLEQKCGSEIEVIVVDDASTDATAEIVKKFPVRLVALKKNAGAGAARNRGAAAAGGGTLVFVDSDVYLESGSLTRVEEFFGKHPEYSALVGNYADFPAHRGACDVYHNFFTVYHHQLSSHAIEWFWGALSAIRKDVFDKLHGFSEQYPGASAEDIELGYRLAESGFPVAFVRNLRGAHGRKFGFRSMLYNDFHKAVLGLKLYWLRRSGQKHKHGFANPINGANVMLAALCWPAALGLFAGSFFILLLLAVFVAINFRFYRFIMERAGWAYLFSSIPLHFLCFNAIAAGTMMGAVGILLGKGLESDSRWV
jgi:glycosyltransferase involved in cell wall biosynthesis